MNEENKNLDENIKRHIDVMLEKVQSDFRVFGDGQKALVEKVDVLTEDIKVVRQDVELLKEDMDFVKGEVVEIRKRFKEVDFELDEKADKIAVDDHEKRIVKLENVALAEA